MPCGASIPTRDSDDTSGPMIPTRDQRGAKGTRPCGASIPMRDSDDTSGPLIPTRDQRGAKGTMPCGASIPMRDSDDTSGPLIPTRDQRGKKGTRSCGASIPTRDSDDTSEPPARDLDDRIDRRPTPQGGGGEAGRTAIDDLYAGLLASEDYADGDTLLQYATDGALNPVQLSTACIPEDDGRPRQRAPLLVRNTGPIDLGPAGGYAVMKGLNRTWTEPTVSARHPPWLPPMGTYLDPVQRAAASKLAEHTMHEQRSHPYFVTPLDDDAHVRLARELSALQTRTPPPTNVYMMEAGSPGGGITPGPDLYDPTNADPESPHRRHADEGARLHFHEAHVKVTAPYGGDEPNGDGVEVDTEAQADAQYDGDDA